MAVTVEKDISV